MPVDVLITYKDGSQEMHYIPSSLMFGQKPAETSAPRTVHEEWKWTHPDYSFSIKKASKTSNPSRSTQARDWQM
jgi:hypothetical protein